MCLVSPEKFDFTNEINIYDDKVAIISFKNELIGMIIESTEIANSQRAIFNMCWQFSKMLETKGKMFDPMSIHELALSTEELKKSSDKKTKAEPLKSNLSMF